MTNPKEKKTMPILPSRSPDGGEEDEEDEYGYFLEPVIHPPTRSNDPPETGSDIPHANIPEDHELGMQVTNTGLGSEETDEGSNPHMQENVEVQDNDNNHLEEQLVEVTEEGDVPYSPYSTSSETVGEEELGYHRPKRERRAPKFFTYEQLGTPKCYNTCSSAVTPCQYPLLVNQDYGPITMWGEHIRGYQPVFMYRC